MRLVYIDDISREAEEKSTLQQPVSIAAGGFEHGGKGDFDEFTRLAKEHGLTVIKFIRGMQFQSDDVVYFCDRKILHFYDGWKMLKEAGMLGRTVAVLIESDVVDRKCGISVLSKIKGAFGAFLTYQDDLIDDKNYFKIWPSIDVSYSDKQEAGSINKNHLASMITTKQVHSENPGEKYSVRLNIVEWFENHPDYPFKVYGRGWDGYRVNGGIIEKKSEAYGDSRFAFCIENCRRNGYITEKIFDCMKEGTIPVYLGAPNAGEYIPKDCFIDYSKFNSVDELVEYLSGMSDDDRNRYLTEIHKFMQSDLSRFTQRTQFDAMDFLKNQKAEKKPGILSSINMFLLVREHERYLYYKKLLFGRKKARK